VNDFELFTQHYIFTYLYVLACHTMNGVVIVERIRNTDVPFYRPPLPPHESEGVHPGILTLMKQCWVEEPSERPSFVEVAKSLKTTNKGKSVCFHCL